MSTQFVHDTRHISLARALHARLYVNCEGRVFACSGQVAHEKLRQALARQDDCPTAAEAPTPHDLGVPVCDGELSSHLLHCICRVLRRWQMELAAEISRSPARRRSATLLASLQQETDTLTARLAALRIWQGQLASGAEPAGAPFFLDPTSEAALRTALRETRIGSPLPPIIAWQARVVCWLSGEVAMRRLSDRSNRVAPGVSHARPARETPQLSTCYDPMEEAQRQRAHWQSAERDGRVYSAIATRNRPGG